MIEPASSHGQRSAAALASCVYSRGLPCRTVEQCDSVWRSSRAPLVGGRGMWREAEAMGFRPRVDLRPHHVGRTARGAVVRGGPDPRAAAAAVTSDQARHLRLLAQQPPSRAVPEGDPRPGRHLVRPLPPRHRQRRRPRRADHGGGAGAQGSRGPLPRVHAPARPAAERGAGLGRGALLRRARRRHAPRPGPVSEGRTRARPIGSARHRGQRTEVDPARRRQGRGAG